jgi:polysaccharide chain length determinant protein (PEP-CTERM system associated)
MNLQELIAQAVDYMRGMWRYRWAMVIAAWVVAIPGWLFVYNMPNVYEASARVSVDTNSLLPGLTKGLTAGENLIDEVELVSRALLTRPNLEKVARETDLDLRADTQKKKEKLISGLLEKVSVRGGRDKIFMIAYADPNREKAVEVVSALLNTFMETSIGAQGDDAQVSERAIRLEIEDHEARLESAEAELAEFKKRNLGYMPDDGGDYYTRLQTALAAVKSTQGKINLLRERRDEIARQLQGEVSLLGSSTTSAQALAACSKAETIAELRSELSALQVAFTDKHPRIVMLRNTIEVLESECSDELQSVGGGVLPRRDSSGQDGEVNTVYENLRIALSNAGVELASLQEQLRSEQRDVSRLKADVDKIADVETEMKQLNRDYSVVSDRYQELLRRWETLQSKRRLDPVTDRVQFNIIEPPFAMATPVAPNRPLLLAFVMVLALGAGGAIAFGLDQLKPVFYHRRTLSQVTGLPVLGSVSMIVSPHDLAVRRRKTIAWAGANLAFLIVGGVTIALAGPISEFVRNLTGSGFQ